MRSSPQLLSCYPKRWARFRKGKSAAFGGGIVVSTRSLALLGVLCCAAPVHAHALGARLRIDKDRVRLEAFYDDDTPAHDASVVVLDGQEKAIAKGKTDAKGLWSFSRPPPGKYQVIVDAGDGHRAVKTLIIPAASGQESERTENGSSPDANPSTQGDDRREFTRFPWLK